MSADKLLAGEADAPFAEGFDPKSSAAAVSKAGAQRRDDGRPVPGDVYIVALPVGMDPGPLPGEGWVAKEEVDGHTIWELDARDDGDRTTEDSVENDGAQTESPNDLDQQLDEGGESEEPIIPGLDAVEDIEEEFSDSASPDGVCLKCIGRGFVKGVVIGAVIAFAVTFALATATGWALVAVVAAVFSLFVWSLKGMYDLTQDWGGMDSHQKQEAVAEFFGGMVGGGLGARGGSISANRFKIGKEQGVSPRTVKSIEKVANDHAVVVEMRPTSPHARKLLEQGTHEPKPMDVKAKTTNSLDKELGAQSELGEAALFKPKDLGPEAPPALRKRQKERQEEWNDHADLREGTGDYYVDNRNAVTRKSDGKKFAGDNDPYAFKDPVTGKAVDPKKRAEVMKDMEKEPISAQHPDVLSWETKTPGQAKAKQKLLDQHKAPKEGNDAFGQEEIIRYAPKKPPKKTFADE